jgi:serine/threonine-protein kinase
MKHLDPEDTDSEAGTVEREPPLAATLASLPPPVSPGPDGAFSTRVGRYDVLRTLGKGSMGEVYLCRDTRIEREVALKRMIPRAPDDGTGRARFLREARVQGQLEHPAVVPVYDLDADGGRGEGAEFFTMKCQRGQTLAEILKALARGDPAVAQRFPCGASSAPSPPPAWRSTTPTPAA